MDQGDNKLFKRYANRIPHVKRGADGKTTALVSPDGSLVLSPGAITSSKVPWANVTDKPVFFDGTWGSLTGKPNLATVAASGAYSDLSGRPNLFSGAYADLTGLPAMFDGKWDSISGKPVSFASTWAMVAGKPTLFDGTWAALTGKPVLFSGAYADLTGRPTLFDGAWGSITGKPAFFGGAYAELTGKPTLFSGSYLDLTDKPSAAPKVLATRVQTDATGKYTWTFSTAFAAGVLPVIGVTVQDTTGASFNHKVIALTNSSVTIQLAKTNAVTVLGVSVLGVDTNPQAFVHLTATAPN